MTKIKEIHDRLIKDPQEYSSITLLIAQRIFTGIIALYFLVYLGTVGGFYNSWISLATLSMLRFHLYTLALLGLVWFGFSWTEHMVYIHAPNKRWISLIVGGILSIICGIGLYIHISPIFS